jgi:uncharacterized membrane protein
MSTANTVLMQQARESLAGKWGQAIGAMVVYLLLMIAIQLIPLAGAIIALLIGGPMAIGLATYSLLWPEMKTPTSTYYLKGSTNLVWPWRPIF